MSKKLLVAFVLGSLAALGLMSWLLYVTLASGDPRMVGPAISVTPPAVTSSTPAPAHRDSKPGTAPDSSTNSPNSEKTEGSNDGNTPGQGHSSTKSSDGSDGNSGNQQDDADTDTQPEPGGSN